MNPGPGSDQAILLLIQYLGPKKIDVFRAYKRTEGDVHKKLNNFIHVMGTRLEHERPGKRRLRHRRKVGVKSAVDS